MSWLIFLLIGAMAGWLAGVLMKGRGFGVVGNVIVGVIGALLGGWLLPRFGVHLGRDEVAALIGALTLLCMIGLAKRA